LPDEAARFADDPDRQEEPMTSLAVWAFGAGSAALFSALILAVPAMLAVRRILARRVSAPLERNALERHLVFFAAVLGAMGALATADGIALLLFDGTSREPGTVLASFVAPVPLAAVPWVAGELLSGASLRPLRAFVAAAAVACATSWAIHALVWTAQPRETIAPLTAAIQLAALFLAGHFAARAYLAARGESLEALPAEAVALERI
jgi:hypothetical protein